MNNQITILSDECFVSQNVKFRKIHIEPPMPLPANDRCVFGYDPGTTRMGVACLWRTYLTVYEVETVRSPDPVVRIVTNQSILNTCAKLFSYSPIMIIEGSSFGNNFRQVELAEVRASAVLWALQHNIVPKIVPPTTIRKAVFGNGKTKADEIWKELPPNAGAALSCAYYQLLTEQK